MNRWSIVKNLSHHCHNSKNITQKFINFKKVIRKLSFNYNFVILQIIIDQSPIMDKTISSSSHDVIVVRQPNNTYKSTPFQVAFSSNLLNNLKNPEVHLYVNNQKIDIPLKLLSNGRVLFIKKYEKRNIFSDSSDLSDDENLQRSKSKDNKVNKCKNAEIKQKSEDYKNQKLPKPFWQFAWLFRQKQSKRQNNIQFGKIPLNSNNQVTFQQNKNSLLSTINEQVYQGEQNSKEPMFHISLCKSSLKKKQRKQQILDEFYKKRISYKQFIKDPIKYLGDSQLIVKVDDSLYTWELGLAILTCRLAFGKQLSPQLIDNIIKNKFTRSKLFTYFTGDDLIKMDISVLDNKKQFTITPNINNPQTKIVNRQNKTPGTNMIQKMNLKQGMNKAKFVLVDENLKQQIILKIFLWDYNSKLIISDIDGTITKSDIAGQLLTNYIHSGVTKLFTEAYKRGYKFVYLTARAIGQYNQTTKFLQNAEQDGIKLPEGPLLMSPDGYWKSLTRQVIDKTPDYLKTKILATLNQIFPNSMYPLYCGFGNRQTDTVSYLRSKMEPEKIFFITPKSQISIESKKNFITNYVEILQKINDYFPIFIKEKENSTNQIFQQNLIQSKDVINIDASQFQSRKITKIFSEDKDQRIYYVQLLQDFEAKKVIQNQKPNQKSVIMRFEKSKSQKYRYNDQDLKESNFLISSDNVNNVNFLIEQSNIQNSQQPQQNKSSNQN